MRPLDDLRVPTVELFVNKAILKLTWNRNSWVTGLVNPRRKPPKGKASSPVRI